MILLPGVVNDDAFGMHGSSIVYDDKDTKQIDSLPPTQIHRNVDLALLEADREGYIKSYIILPGAVYGRVSNKLVDLGIQKTRCILLNLLLKPALERGVSGMIGKGLNTYVNVEVSELADLYIILYDSITSNIELGHGNEGYYFAESDEYLLYDLSKEIGRALVEAGKSQSAEPTSFTEEEIGKWFGRPLAGLLAGNSRCRGNRSRDIGWRPTKTTADLFAIVGPELNALL